MRPAPAVVAACGLLVLTGCQSTQDKASRLRAAGTAITHQKGLKLTTSNPDVKVVDRAVLQDRYGTAAVVELQNTSEKAMVAVPVAIDVMGARKQSLYRNDAGGIDASLTSAALLPPGRKVVWVNNQITAAGKPSTVGVKVGDPRSTAAGAVPDITASELAVSSDIDGSSITGVIENHSRIVQKRITVYGVARRGGTIVAAGRSVIDTLDPAPTKKPVRFSIYVIGNPKGARLSVSAPPVQLK
jgi:hypothetical protein